MLPAIHRPKESMMTRKNAPSRIVRAAGSLTVREAHSRIWVTDKTGYVLASTGLAEDERTEARRGQVASHLLAVAQESRGA
jgi:hypothetical protein